MQSSLYRMLSRWDRWSTGGAVGAPIAGVLVAYGVQRDAADVPGRVLAYFGFWFGGMGVGAGLAVALALPRSRASAPSGNVNYELPAGADLESPRFAVIYCVPFSVVFATAELN